MLEREKAVDAVLCATPDHLHACVSVTAMRLKKHVYCEKPLTHNIWEARLVARVAKETGVATQMGNQGHSGGFIRQTCEIIWDGAIGEVREVHAWTSATRWNKELSGRPPDEPVPAGVNWDLWLGPRELRGYSSALNPVRWRDFWDFGTAPIGDFFCHNFDPAFWALDLREPLTVEAILRRSGGFLYCPSRRPLHLSVRAAWKEATGQVHLVRRRPQASPAGRHGRDRFIRRQRYPVYR